MFDQFPFKAYSLEIIVKIIPLKKIKQSPNTEGA